MTTKSFNETHPLGHLLNGEVAKGLPSKPEEIDLRFLTMIGLGDTYNGENNPTDGVSYKAVLYGNQIAWEQYAIYSYCSCELRSNSGNELYRTMYHASRLYLKVQAVARALFFKEQLEKGVDTFHMSSADLETLSNHPQWEEMVNDMGLELRPVGKKGKFSVVVSKFYQRS